jgi:hypothetical protein
MRARGTLIVVGIATLVVIVLLIASANHYERALAFSIDVDPGPPVATLSPGQTACQGPIDAIAPIGSLYVWVNPDLGPTPRASITVRDYATGTALATGSVPGGYIAATAPQSVLNRPVPQGKTISVCLRDTGRRPVKLIGDVPNTRSGKLTAAGHPEKEVLALLFDRPRSVTLWSQIPTVFSRAALFRASWVGSWTFWVLAVLLAGTFGGVVYAVVQAERDDIASAERTSAQ